MIARKSTGVACLLLAIFLGGFILHNEGPLAVASPFTLLFAIPAFFLVVCAANLLRP